MEVNELVKSCDERRRSDGFLRWVYCAHPKMTHDENRRCERLKREIKE